MRSWVRPGARLGVCPHTRPGTGSRVRPGLWPRARRRGTDCEHAESCQPQHTVDGAGSVGCRVDGRLSQHLQGTCAYAGGAWQQPHRLVRFQPGPETPHRHGSNAPCELLAGAKRSSRSAAQIPKLALRRQSRGRTAGVVRSGVGHAVGAGSAGGRPARREVAAQHVDAEAGAALGDEAPQRNAIRFTARLGVARRQGLYASARHQSGVGAEARFVRMGFAGDREGCLML